jgi:hypothetical protein
MATSALLAELRTELADTERRVKALRAAIEALAEIPFPKAPARGRPRSASVAAAPKAGARRRKRKGRTFTPAQRKAQAERMRAYWKARKTAKK